MNIDKLKSKRQKNVQEQNELQLNDIEKCAFSYINHPEKYLWLTFVLSQKGLCPEDGILVDFTCCLEQGLIEDCGGLFLTKRKEFYSFDVELEYETYNFISLESWVDITNNIPVNAHVKGTGKSFGFLALDVLEKLTS